MPQGITITHNKEQDRYEGKLSEVCKNNPFIPVQIGIVIEGKTLLFFKRDMVRVDGALTHVEYVNTAHGFVLWLINDK